MFLIQKFKATSYSLCCWLAAAAVATSVFPSHVNAENPKVEQVDLSKADAKYAMTIEVPAGAKVSDGFSGPEVVSGETFKIQISATAADLAKRKEEIKSNTLNKFKQYVVDQRDAILYETTVFGASEFHFVINVKVGDKTYSIEDVKGPAYTKDQCEFMLKCARTLSNKK